MPDAEPLASLAAAPAAAMSLGPPGQGTAELYRLLVEIVEDYAIFALDPEGRVLSWNRGAQRFKGYTADEIVGKHFSVFYPREDVAARKPQRELEDAARDGRVEDEGWRVRKDGTRFWANVVITALRDDTGALVGFAKVTRDLTERRASEEQARRLAAERAALAEAERRSEELARLNEQLREQATELAAQTEEAQALAEELEETNEQLADVAAEAEESRELAIAAERFTRGVLASIADPFVVHDAAWCFRFINARAEAVFTATRGEDLLGRNVWDVYPELVGTPLHAVMVRAAAERAPVSEEVFVPSRGTWTELHCYPLADGGVATSWRDVSARKRAEEARAILAEAGAALASSLDYETTLGALARLVVPRLADWCAVDMAPESPGGPIRRLAVAHADPARVRFAWELWARYPADPAEPHGVARVLRTGAPELIPEVTNEMLAAIARDAEHLALARALGLRSAMIVPLTSGERVLGALSLVSAESGRRYATADLALAEELARRAATAIASAELHRDAVRAREAAERAAREAAAANRAKADFLAVMSHELRTPLNAIAGHAELIELGIHGPVTPAQLEALGRIRNSQRHLLSLINDVLNFAKLEAGHVQVAAAPFAVDGLLQEIEGLIAPQLRAKRLAYVRAAPADGRGLVARADREKVGQVLINLLSNAIKFTPAGGRVEVGAEVAAGGDAVAIHVRDTGVGIPADKLAAAFEPFVQVTRDLATPHEGTGLGLSISRDLARLMGGELTAVSAAGEGSTFTLTVPRAADAADAADATA